MKRACRLATGALWMLVGLAVAGSAQRAAAELRLEWRAPRACPDEAQFAENVHRLLGEAVSPNLTATTQVSETFGAYRARLTITSAAGFAERTLESERCDVLAESVALVIALSVAPPDDSAQSEVDPSLRLAAYAGTLLGPLPEPALGLGGAVAVEWPFALRLALHGTYFLPQSAAFATTELERPTPGADIDLLAFGARACFGLDFGAFEPAACVGAELYHVTAVGSGARAPREDAATIFGPTAGLLGRLQLAPAFALVAFVEGVVPLSRPRLLFSDYGAVHDASSVALSMLIASEVRL